MIPTTAKSLACRVALTLVMLMALASNGTAHTPSETYLDVRVDGTNVTARWDVALRDLHQGMGLDPQSVPSIRPEELRDREEALALDVAAGLTMSVNSQRIDLAVTDYTTLPLNDVEYARLVFAGSSGSTEIEVIEIDAAAVFRVDTNMHGLMRVEHGGRVDAVAFDRQQAIHAFHLKSGQGKLDRWLTFITEGVWHIWIGFDHILFLMALLLPAVLFRENRQWRGVAGLRPAFMNVLKIVTAFTAAHSITLTLAALNLVRLPSRLVESVIAASVAIAAANNLWPVAKGKNWMMAGGFGLIHGFGFASVLGDLGLAKGNLAVALVGFNVGVELGQIAIVASFLPLAFALRKTALYQIAVFKYGSILIVLVAVFWMVERILGLTV